MDQTDALLAWALPRIGLRWEGFRRVKRQVRRRVMERIADLGLADAAGYAAYLEQTPSEWDELEARCGVTISRFHRDREVFDCIERDLLPAMAARAPGGVVNVWSAGCASGEEAYSIALIWELALAERFRGCELRVLASERDAGLLERAARGCYRRSSLRELPAEWIERAFRRDAPDLWCLAPELRRSVTFERRDLRRTLPDETFDLILCRNLAFSYFDASEQRRMSSAFLERLRPGGALVIGLRESLPETDRPLRRQPQSACVFRV